MQAYTNVLLAEEQAIGTVSLEITPDLFHWVELGGISREPFHVEAWMSGPKSSHVGAFVYEPLVPQKNNMPPEVLKKLPDKLSYMLAVEVSLLKPGI